ncbi:MAG: class I SAM-dependent methyltransferase [Spirochaetes bacterium]|nr:class I SAM-dependent methyltransferase [Spirochaetota bacterium]
MKEHHIFPWWAGYLLINPLRKLRVDPHSLLGSYIQPGMNILDAGCAMGFFSIPLAEMTGPGGTVFCVDPQKKMLAVLSRRAKKKGLEGIIDVRECSYESLQVGDLDSRIDLALAFGVLHETRDKKVFLKEIASTMRPGGLFVLGEPHVISREQFDEELEMVEAAGFILEKRLSRGSNSIAIMHKLSKKQTAHFEAGAPSS